MTGAGGNGEDILADLGLELDTTPFVVDLAHGVRLVGHRPDSVDITRARVAVAEVFGPADKLRTAADRYRFTPRDRKTIANPESWVGVSEYATAVELACIVITTVEGPEKNGARRQVPATADTFAQLFRLDDNLALWTAATEIASRSLIQPKKEPAP